MLAKSARSESRPSDIIGERPSKAAAIILRFFCSIVDVVPTRADEDGARAQQLGCRFLLSLFVMDALSWGAFRVIQFEAIRNADYADSFDTFGLSPVIFITIMVTLEQTIEFLASAVVPFIFRLFSGSTRFEIHTLGAFCMRLYTLSHFAALCVALVFSPCILGGANGPNDAEVDKCDATSCACVNANQSCPLVWLSGSNYTRECCVNSGTAQEYCELLNGDSSSCPLSQTSMAWVFACVYWMCYCFVNQLGDASLEMSKTQWLDAFTGTDLVLPGCLASMCPCAVRRPASAKALSTYLTILRTVVQSFAGLSYFLVRSRARFRLSLILLLASVGFIGGLSLAFSRCCRKAASAEAMLKEAVRVTLAPPAAARAEKGPPLTPSASIGSGSDVRHGGGGSIAGEGVRASDDEVELIISMSELRPMERSLVVFLILTRGLPQQANDSIVAYFGSNGVAALIARAMDGGSESARDRAEQITSLVAVLLFLVAFLYLLRKVTKLPRAPGAASVSSRPFIATTVPVSVQWLRLVWVLFTCTVVSGCLLVLPILASMDARSELALVVLALLCYVPYLPARYTLQVVSDAFLIQYDSARSPSIVYWTNVGVVVISWPVLGIVWAVVTLTPTMSQDQISADPCGAEEQNETTRTRGELGLVVLIASSILFIAATYYSLLDPKRPAHLSLMHALDATGPGESVKRAPELGGSVKATCPSPAPHDRRPLQKNMSGSSPKNGSCSDLSQSRTFV